MKTILSTRMLNKTSIKRLHELNVRVIIEEAIGIEEIESPELQEGSIRAEAFIFTSLHGATSFSSQVSEELKIPSVLFAIEGRTSTYILNEPWAQHSRIITASNAAELADKIKDSGIKNLAYFCAEGRRDELPQAIGNDLKEYVVYKSVLTPVKAMSSPEVVLFFSPSAVQSFTSANNIQETTTAFCIGETTAEEARKYTSRIIVSPKASEEELILELEKHLRNNTI